jgi:hypothetical protein
MLREQQREHVLQAEIQAGKLRRSLAENVERKLPPEIHGSTTNTILQVSHIVHTSFELLEIADALPHVLHAVGPAMGYIAMPLTVVGPIDGTGRSRRSG